MANPEVIEYVPASRSTGMAGRFAKAMFFFGLPFALFAVYRDFHLGNDDISVVLLVATPAMFFWGLGLIGSLVSYTTAGRAW